MITPQGEEQRLVCRTHGGATIHADFNDLPLSYKHARDRPEKERIGQHAVRLVDGARVIGTTGGTTVSQFIRLLRGRDDLTVVTNALNVAIDLVGSPGPRVFVAGGEVRGSSQESVGISAEAFLAEYNIDIAFLGVDGVDGVDAAPFLDDCPGALDAQFTAVLDAVAAAPPPPQRRRRRGDCVRLGAAFFGRGRDRVPMGALYDPK